MDSSIAYASPQVLESFEALEVMGMAEGTLDGNGSVLERIAILG